MEECSPLYSKTLQNILKIFLKSLVQQKGIKRNLLIKKFIKNILYSKEQIQINLFYSEDFDAFKNSDIPSKGWLDENKNKDFSFSFRKSSVRIVKNDSTLKITANRPYNFTKFNSSGKRKKFKEITAQ